MYRELVVNNAGRSVCVTLAREVNYLHLLGCKLDLVFLSIPGDSADILSKKPDVFVEGRRSSIYTNVVCVSKAKLGVLIDQSSEVQGVQHWGQRGTLRRAACRVVFWRSFLPEPDPVSAAGEEVID